MYYSKSEIKDVAIKPCPFCGNIKLYVTDQKDYEELCEKNGHAMLSIECKVCDTELKMYNIPNNNYWMGVGMLIAKWNTRHGGNKDAD